MKIYGRLVDIHKRKIYPAEITVEGNRIERIREAGSPKGSFILPGFIDAHVHIESSMVTPGAFAAAALRHGTVGVVSDPHEIANVMGKEGVEFMIRDGKKVPFYFWFGAPSCVPATRFETSGSRLDAGDIDQLLKRKDIKYLSEMMNFPGVIYGDREVKSKIESAVKYGKPVDGHAPGLTGNDLKKYVSAGISTDHECSTIDEALEKIDLGMKILIREGSAARNLDTLKSLVRSHPEKVMLCSDDLHPEMLQKGHINRLVSSLVKEGFDIFNVLRSCTINPVEHYGLDAGLLREGDSADFIITGDISEMQIDETWIRGEKVFSKAGPHFSSEKSTPVNKFHASEISADQIKVERKGNKIRVIEATDGQLLTRSLIVEAVMKKFIESDTERDILKIVVKDRYNDQPPVTGFIKGLGLRKGAFASSVAHDSHNIIAAGTDDNSIVQCINEIIRIKGGLSVSTPNGVSSLNLPVAGIMSDRPVDEVASSYTGLSEAVRSSGCTLKAPFMTLSFMALLVIPELKISDRGLFDGTSFTFTNLFTD